MGGCKSVVALLLPAFPCLCFQVAKIRITMLRTKENAYIFNNFSAVSCCFFCGRGVVVRMGKVVGSQLKVPARGEKMLINFGPFTVA